MTAKPIFSQTGSAKAVVLNLHTAERIALNILGYTMTTKRKAHKVHESSYSLEISKIGKIAKTTQIIAFITIRIYNVNIVRLLLI